MRNKTTQAHRLPWGVLRVFVVLMAMMAAFATDVSAQGTVKGKVFDETGAGLPGANVFVKGTTIGTITDMDGNYVISNVPAGSQTITASFIGYQNMELTFSMSDGATITQNFTLKEDNEELDEVVVIGYGVQKKKLVTGATVEVKGEDIQKMNTTQVLGALQSQSPGVNIQSNSGQPGDGFKISIRGAGTNGSTAPIYVIDGVAGGDINSLNPADIERIDVLKDAASCAIYGSSSANGVILITTKQGKAGKVQVTYDGTVGWSNVYKMPDLLNASEYKQIQDIVAFNAGQTTYDWAQYTKGYENYEGTNWLEELRNPNAITTSHSVNIIGGNDVSKFSTGFGYQYQDGVFGGEYIPSDFSRFTFRLNSEHSLWKSKDGSRDIIKFGENLYFQHRKSEGIQIGNQYVNVISDCLRAIPLIPVYNKEGDYFMGDDLKEMGMFGFNSYASNPIAGAVNNQSGNNVSKNYNLNTNAYVEVSPIKNLTYKGLLSYKVYGSSWRCYLPEYYMNDQGGKRDQDQTTDNLSLGFNWGVTNTVNYRFDVADKNHFDVMVGTEYSKSRPGYGESVNITGYNNIFNDMDHAYIVNTTGTTYNASGSPAGYGAKMSYFGRINYDFNEALMFSAVMRADGSSQFAEGNQWGYFPSVSAGWVISNMSFMQNQGIFDFLKLRAGWGQNGNDNLPSSSWRSTWEFGDYGLYSFGNNKDNGTQGAYATRLANPDLTWETSEQTNIGIDMRFLKSRLTATFDWYNKETKDLLIAVQTNAATGFDSQYQNAGNVKNTGVEISLGWNDSPSRDFSYSVNWNMAYNKNEVTKVNNANKYIEGGNDLLAQNTGIMARMQEGYSIGYFYGFKTDGVIQNEADKQAYIAANCGGDAANSLQGADLAVGDLKFVDTNGDGVINDEDKTDLGNPTPDLTMGFSLGANYKGFDFAATFYGAFGQQVARSWRKFTDGQYENYTSEVYEYWTGEGTSNKYPLLQPGNRGMNFQKISDIYIEDANYVRLANITLGYDFKQLWKTCPLQQIRFYVAAQNMFTITKYKGMDPENGMALNGNEPWVTGVDVGNYPNPRTFLFGVNIKF